MAGHKKEGDQVRRGRGECFCFVCHVEACYRVLIADLEQDSLLQKDDDEAENGGVG